MKTVWHVEYSVPAIASADGRFSRESYVQEGEGETLNLALCRAVALAVACLAGAELVG